MTLAEIKNAIEELPEEEKKALASWLATVDRRLWDAEITKDFSPGGLGMELLEEVDAQIDKREF